MSELKKDGLLFLVAISCLWLASCTGVEYENVRSVEAPADVADENIADKNTDKKKEEPGEEQVTQEKVVPEKEPSTASTETEITADSEGTGSSTSTGSRWIKTMEDIEPQGSQSQLRETFTCELIRDVFLTSFWKHYTLKDGLVDRSGFADTAIKALISTFDHRQVLFTQSEVDSFMSKYNEDLIIYALGGQECEHFKPLKDELLSLLAQRADLLESYILKDHDFTVKEYISLDGVGENFDWPTANQLHDRMRRYAKYRILNFQETLDKDWVDRDSFEVRSSVVKRFRRSIEQFLSMEDYDFHYWYLQSLYNALDKNSDVLDYGEAEAMHQGFSDELVGLGIGIESHNSGYILVRYVGAEGAAGRDGRMKSGDIITALSDDGENWTSMKGKDVSEAVQLITGVEGTVVYLKMFRESSAGSKRLRAFELSLTRQRVTISQIFRRDELPYHIYEIEDEKFPRGIKVGYIRQNSFNRRSAVKIINALEAMKERDQLDVLLMDYRWNSGGSLDAAVDVVNVFFESPQVSVIQEKFVPLSSSNNTPKYEMTPLISEVHQKIDSDLGLPLVFLVSSHSASAAELSVGALKKHGRALVVGDKRTFGKGTIQTFSLFSPPSAGSELAFSSYNREKGIIGGVRYTIGKYFLPDGSSIQQVGETSDVVITSFNNHTQSPSVDASSNHPFLRNQLASTSLKSDQPLNPLAGLGFRDPKILTELQEIYDQRTSSEAYQAENKGWLDELDVLYLRKYLRPLYEVEARENTVSYQLNQKTMEKHRLFDLSENRWNDELAQEIVEVDHQLDEALFLSAHYFHLCRYDESEEVITEAADESSMEEASNELSEEASTDESVVQADEEVSEESREKMTEITEMAEAQEPEETQETQEESVKPVEYDKSLGCIGSEAVTPKK